MVRPLRLTGGIALALGVVLTVDAVVRGNASAFLVVIVPVVAGSSLEFAAAVLLMLLGVGLLFAEAMPIGGDGPGEGESRSSRPAGGSGGVILVGPVPIFWGNWSGVRTRARWAWAAGGAVLFGVALVVYWLAVGGR